MEHGAEETSVLQFSATIHSSLYFYRINYHLNNFFIVADLSSAYIEPTICLHFSLLAARGTAVALIEVSNGNKLYLGTFPTICILTAIVHCIYADRSWQHPEILNHLCLYAACTLLA